MKGSLQRLETKPFPLEREWTVEGVPVLRLSGTLPQPVGKPSRLTRRPRSGMISAPWRARTRTRPAEMAHPPAGGCLPGGKSAPETARDEIQM